MALEQLKVNVIVPLVGREPVCMVHAIAKNGLVSFCTETVNVNGDGEHVML